ncbi:MAG: asparaginase [Rhodobacteraceae bacterium]|nr:asparaginase [Paracoccaceae bacterium]
MTQPVPMAEVWRGEFLESIHRGHAVICDASGEIVEAWGDPEAVILPRSSIKMIQGLPLIESGAAEAAGLTDEQIGLACASHGGAPIHTDRVKSWLADIGLTDDDLRCGAQPPTDTRTRHAMIRADEKPCQCHNNCSGKHTGFLTLTKHLGAGPEYVDIDHPVQVAVKEAFETMTGQTSPGYGIDGCSAPNFASSLHGIARAMALFAAADEDGPSVRQRAAARLARCMRTYPELVAGEGRACTELMRAMEGRVTIKTGAEAVFTAIIPEKKLGIALKIVDGSPRGSECAITSLLVRLGVLDPNHPAAKKFREPPIVNWRGTTTGFIRPAGEFV